MDNPKTTYYINGNIRSEHWHKGDKRHRLDGPAYSYYYKNGNIETEYWYNDHKRHRLDGPAVIYYNENGNIEREIWFLNNNEINPPYKNYPLTKEQQIEMKLLYG